MSSRFHAASLAMGALLLLSACDREKREPRGAPLPETAAKIQAGGDPRAADYENNSFHISEGQRLYGWMNCVGCHAMGGGGMGPPLMDDEWRYGGTMEQIVDTILEGRPNGMPTFRGKITEQQAWQLAAFVRGMSAQPRQDALPSRSDDISNREPLTIDERQDVKTTDPKTDQKTPQ